MALTSTLFTGLSGLNVNQTRLNVVGNNIANVNTTAFKASRTLFKPQFYVTESGGTPPSGDFGGTNPSQRGLGATVASIERDFSNGSIETTGKQTDLAIDGNGFFVVRGTETAFTRDGTFTLNSSNELVTSTGDYVQGYGVDANGQVIDGKLQNLKIPLGSNITASATKTITLEGNLNASGDVATGASILLSPSLTTAAATAPVGGTLLTDLRNGGAAPFAAGDVLTLAAQKGGRALPPSTFTVTAASTMTDLLNFYNQRLGIDTTVTATPTPGAVIDPDPLDPNAIKISIVGNIGAENSLAIPGSGFLNATGASPFRFNDGTNAAGIASKPSGESVHTTVVGYDSLGSEVSVDVTMTLVGKSSSGTTWQFLTSSADNQADNLSLGNGTLTFGTDGKLLTTVGDTVTVDRSNTGAVTPLSMKLDMGSLTALTSRDSDLVMTDQDGTPTGTLNAFSIGADGVITGSYSNGRTSSLGQVATAMFDNPQGLVDGGGNKYLTGASSGVPIVTKPLALGSGALRSGALELSNVDLSKEFINLIIASTGFSASSRVITTSDQLLTELLNSAR